MSAEIHFLKFHRLRQLWTAVVCELCSLSLPHSLCGCQLRSNPSLKSQLITFLSFPELRSFWQILRYFQCLLFQLTKKMKCLFERCWNSIASVGNLPANVQVWKCYVDSNLTGYLIYINIITYSYECINKHIILM